ncbi:MAG: helix-turn-helix transcriptional regulator [Bacteriovoracaceae bacterium]|nr:helix-turn-helix transcriptional regulator [Bacteriovoracaceae bacterium]
MEYTHLVIKALRKYNGYQQASFCKFLNIQQGTLSKIESGLLSINATVWIDICMKFKINPEAIITGRIEMVEDLPLKLRQEVAGNMKVKKRFTRNMGSTVRTVYPLINFLRHQIGMDKTNELLKHLGAPPEYFVIQNLPISILFINDLINEITRMGLIDQNNVTKLLDFSEASQVHQYPLSSILVNDHAEQNFKRFTKTIKEMYEVNTTYQFVGEDDNFIEARDNKHMSEVDTTEDFEAFRALYNEAHFNMLAPMLHSKARFKATKVEGGWNLRVA